MKKTKVIKSLSKHNLGDDIWFEILSWLPVKCLVRFRCVSKTWRSLIDNSSFSRLHVNHFKNNCNETHLFVVQGPKRHHVIRCSNTFKTIARLEYPKSHHRCIPVLPLEVFCSTDGLVMLMSYCSLLKPCLMLWNPSIRKSRWLPPLPTDSSYMSEYVDLGIGYAPLIKDYKLIRLAFDAHSILCWIGVYTIGSGSWKTIQFQGKRPSDWWCWSVASNWENRPVCFNGSLYIIAANDDSFTEELVSFDLSTELFDVTPLPYKRGYYEHDALILVDGGRSLAVFDYTVLQASQASVWVLQSSGGDNDSMYWTKRYTFCVFIDEFLYLKKNGDLLMGMRQVHSYNAETDEAKILLKNRIGVDIIRVFSYKESLILP